MVFLWFRPEEKISLSINFPKNWDQERAWLSSGENALEVKIPKYSI